MKVKLTGPFPWIGPDGVKHLPGDIVDIPEGLQSVIKCEPVTDGKTKPELPKE